jgi:hypothetical protein
VADIDATFKQQVFDLPQRQRIADVHHHREADYLGRTIEITKGIAHRWRLWNAPVRLKPICSDTAGLAYTYAFGAHFGHSESPEADAHKALELADKAISIDDHHALAHGAAGGDKRRGVTGGGRSLERTRLYAQIPC